MVSRADGLFLVPAIAAGHARFRITVDPALPVLPRIPDVEVHDDAIARVEIRLERTVRVRGTIRSRETGDPVAGAEILIGHGPSKEGRKAVSDAQGRVEVNTLPGDVTMQVMSTTSSFVQVGDDPSSQRHHVPAGAWPLTCRRSRSCGVTARDGWWMPETSRSRTFRSMPTLPRGIAGTVPGTTDQNGAFTMLIPSGVPLKYRYSFDQGGAPQGLDPVGEAPIVRENPLLLRAPGRKSPQAVEGLPQSEP